MPEELCQISPKSHYVSLALHSDPSPFRSYGFEEISKKKRPLVCGWCLGVASVAGLVVTPIIRPLGIWAVLPQAGVVINDGQGPTILNSHPS